jgi:prolyl-tRNA synthetase
MGMHGAVRPTAVCIRSDLPVSARKLAAVLGARNVALLDPAVLPGLLGKPAGALTPWDCLDIDVVCDVSAASREQFTIADGPDSPDGVRHGASWPGGNGLASITPAQTRSRTSALATP